MADSDRMQLAYNEQLSRRSKRVVGASGLIHDEGIIEIGVATETSLLSVNDADETFKVALLIHAHFKLPPMNLEGDTEVVQELKKAVERYTADENGVNGFERVDDYNLYSPTIVMVNCVETQFEEFVKTTRFNKRTGDIWISFYNTCTISESLELEKFPFDRQLFRIVFKSADARLRGWTIETDILDFPKVRTSDKAKQDEVASHLVACELKNWFMEGFFVEYFPDDDDPASLTQGEFAITIRAERDPKFYFFNFYFVMYLIVLTNVSLASVSPGDSGDRHALTITLLLTLVAFKFVLIEGTPKVGYLTYMDKYVISSYLFTMAAVIENIFVSPLVLCVFIEDFDCEVQEDLDQLVIDVKSADNYFHLGFALTWSLLNLAMAIVCFFPHLARYSWQTVEDDQIGTTEDTVKRTNIVGDGNANEREKLKRLGIPLDDEDEPEYAAPEAADGTVEVQVEVPDGNTKDL